MKLKTRDVVYIAMYAALFVVMDRLTDMISLFAHVNGGKLNLATVVILLASYHLGWKKGILVGVVSCVLMYVTGSMSSSGGNIVSLLLDYFLAYTVYGVASLFPNIKNTIFTGVVITNLARLAFSTISGIVVWGSPFAASLSYNAGYMIPTMIFDLIVVPILYTALKPIMKRG